MTVDSFAYANMLLKRVVEVPGFKHLVAYDEEDDGGYWLCSVCKSLFFPGGEDLHLKGCSLLPLQKSDPENYKKKMVMVVGPKTEPLFLRKETLDRIREIAKAAATRS